MRTNFWLGATLLFALIAVSVYSPAFFGKVPFPRDMVLQFPAWAGMARSEAWRPYADIGDLVTAFYPTRAFAAQTVREGSLPLWNPYFLGGAPFLASPQSSLFYPPNFFYYVFPVPTAWTLCLMLRLFLSGIFMTLFVRSIGGSKAGAIFSGIVFSLCGFMTGWQGQPMADAAAWLPFACYSVIRIQNEPSRVAIALAAIGFAMPVVAGHPETAAHITLVATTLALVTFAFSGRDTRFLLRFAFAGALAVGLASIQLIPTLEWLAQLRSPLNARWPPLAIHEAFGWVSRDMLRTPNSAGLWIPESAAYVGMITLLIAPFGLLHRARKQAIFLFVVSAVAIAMAYGIQPMHWLAGHTPVLAGLKNGRLIFVAAFGLAALAGLGLSALEELPATRRHRIIAFAMLMAAFGLGFLFVYKLQLATQFRVEFTRRPSFSRAMLLVGLIPILWRLASPRTSRAFPLAACAVIAFDLLTFSFGYTGFASPNEIFPPAPVFDFLAEHSDPAQFRVASLGTPYPSNANLMYGTAAVDGYEVRLSPLHQLFSRDYMEDRMDGIFFISSRLLKFNDRRLDLLNVKYVVTQNGNQDFELLRKAPRFELAFNNGYVAVFENKSVLPRAFAVPLRGVQVLTDINYQLATLRNPEFDPQRGVVVSDVQPSLQGQVEPEPRYPLPFSNSVQISQSGINNISIRASTSERAVLVVSQTYYPGWKATVDGNPADVFPVNMTLTGVALPAGSHDVRLIFDPMSFKAGAIVTLLAAVILAVTYLTHPL